jgi:plasmid maintenance system antidote protein VapI
MNLRKSVKQACINADIKQKDLAEKLGMKPQQLNCTIARNSTSFAMLTRLASAFDMKVSEFIALGE